MFNLRIGTFAAALALAPASLFFALAAAAQPTPPSRPPSGYQPAQPAPMAPPAPAFPPATASQATAQPGEADQSEPGWPREYQVNQFTFTVYQPQVETWDHVNLTSRAAVAVQRVGAEGMEYGTIKLNSRTLIDKEIGAVLLTDITIPEGNFPTAPDKGTAYVAALRTHFGTTPVKIALGRLEAGLAIAQAGKQSVSEPIDNQPPRIIFSSSPALLVLIDGPPALRPFGATAYMRVINTRALVVLDQARGSYYLRALGSWMKAPAIEGPWTHDPAAAPALQPVLTEAGQQQGIDLLDPIAGGAASPAQITLFVSTTPAELIQTNGVPNFLPIPNTQILYCSNTESQLFLYLPEQKFHFLVSGRWFRSASLEKGPWEYVDQGKLPADFARIPEEHPSGGALASVQGTPQATEAVISNSIPQTAEIQRNGPTLNVTYDGQPSFEPISGTPLSCAANTYTPVIQVAPSSYYAVDNAVWFNSASPVGPWAVASEVPAVIYTIPVRHRLHFCTFARVYWSTPTTVVCGYTPGYFGTLVAPSGCIVYGPGYGFHGYCGSFWVPPIYTYGWGASFACGFRTGFAFGFTAGWLVGAWYHPCWGGFGWNDIHFDHFNHISFNHYNTYHHWESHVVNRDRFAPVARPRAASSLHAEHNLVAGRDGAVYRRTSNGALERHDNGAWKPMGSSAADHQRATEVNRVYESRGYGEERTRAASPASPTMNYGGFHGGTGGGYRSPAPASTQHEGQRR